MRLLLLAALAATLAGCDFTPTLDIETPPHDARAVVRAILVADSVASVRVSRSLNPYESNSRLQIGTAVDAVVTLVSESGAEERLVLRPETCRGDGGTRIDPETGQPVFTGEQFECGAFVGRRALVPGETVTIRALVPGRPPAEAKVTIPVRPALALTETTSGPSGPRRLVFRFSDPAQQPNRYYVSVLSPVGGFRSIGCIDNVCTDTSYVAVLGRPYPIPTTTTDPVLALDNILDPGGRSFFVFADDTFDGQSKEFSLETGARTGVVQDQIVNAPLTVRFVALSPALYQSYRQSRALAVSRDLPFAEPANGATNVEGGYGLVGAAAITEINLDAR